MGGNKMSDRPTPETDAAWSCFKGYMEPLQDVKDLSQKLERERDEAREKYTTLLTDNMLDVHKLYKAIELIKSLINQIERPAYGIDEAVAKMFLMEDAKKFANEMQ
jgi:esterase/lipase